MKFNKKTTACFSGYRPHKFDFPLEGMEYERLTSALYESIIKATEAGYEAFMIGMAAGYDIMAGEALGLAKRNLKEGMVKIICVLPYSEFKNSKHFDAQWRKRYDSVLDESDGIINVTGKSSFSPSCYYARNRFMVDNSSLLICYSDGKAGGTEQTVEYAKRCGISIVNLA